MQDSELVEKILKREKGAFEILVNNYYEGVLKISNGLLHHHQNAEDITQDVFVEIHQSIHKFRKESSLSTWIFRITINKSLNFLKKNKRRQLYDDPETPGIKEKIGQQNSHESETEKTERAAILHRAVDSLPNNQKIAFTLVKYDDMSYKEVADVLDVSLSSVESLMFRAKKNLQKKLVNYYKRERY